MKAVGTGVPMGENSLLLAREPRETPNQTPYKVLYVAQEVLSLGFFGYLLYESITGRTVTAMLGTAASLVSAVGAGVGLWNANQCQKAFEIDSQQEVGDFSTGGMVNVTEDVHEETQGKKQLEEQIRRLQEQLQEQGGVVWRKEQELIALESKHKLSTDKTLEEVKSAKGKLNVTIDLLQGQLEDSKRLVESLMTQIADLTAQNDLLTETLEEKDGEFVTSKQLHEITLKTLEDKKGEIASLKELLQAPRDLNASSDTSRSYSETDPSNSSISALSPVRRVRTSKGGGGSDSE